LADLRHAFTALGYDLNRFKRQGDPQAQADYERALASYKRVEAILARPTWYLYK
jgi:hypothetical protein